MTDAGAICETASRPMMRFVPIKTCEQQAVMSLHRMREGYKEERTACINRIRGVLAEYGLVFGKSPKVLRAVLADVLEDAGNTMPGLARLVVQRAFDHWRELDEQGQPGADHQARRRLPAHAADPGGQVRGDERGQARRPDIALAAAAHRAGGLAEGVRGDGQQERAHPVGGDDARARLRRAACERQAAGQVQAAGAARAARAIGSPGCGAAPARSLPGLSADDPPINPATSHTPNLPA